jgi:hypothetical protein
VRGGIGAFVRARRFALGSCLLVGVGTTTYLFGSLGVPILNTEDSAYGVTVLYTVAPILAAVVALGMLHSRLSLWERLAIRRLMGFRIGLALVTACIGWLTLVPAAMRVDSAHPLALAAQSGAACFGLGLLVGTCASYEWQVASTTSYGVVSLLVTPALHHPTPLLLVGAYGAPRLALALVVLAVALLLHALARPNVTDNR